MLQFNKVLRRCKVHSFSAEKNRAQFECGNCEHQWSGPIMKKPEVGALPPVAILRKTAKYWKDGVSTYCPKCSKVRTNQNVLLRRG